MTQYRYAKHTVMGSLQLYADYQELHNFKLHQLTSKQSDSNLSCRHPSAKFASLSTEVNMQNEINLDHTPQIPQTQKVLDDLCEEFKAIYSLHQGDVGHTKSLNVDIDTGCHPSFAQKPHLLPLKHTRWVREELKMLQKAGIISQSVSPWSISIVIVPKKAQPEEQP